MTDEAKESVRAREMLREVWVIGGDDNFRNTIPVMLAFRDEGIREMLSELKKGSYVVGGTDELVADRDKYKRLFEEMRDAEHKLSEAYVRLRLKIPGAAAYDPNLTTEQFWQHVEDSLDEYPLIVRENYARELGKALRMFAPDLADQLRARWGVAQQYLDDFMAFMRAER